MTAITTAKNVDRRYIGGDAGEVHLPMTASTSVYEGTFVGLPSGYLSSWTNDDNTMFAGICAEAKTESDGTAGSVEAMVYQSGDFLLALSGVAVTDVGKEVYATDNATLTLTEDFSYPVGKIVKYDSSGWCWVRIDGYAGVLPNQDVVQTKTIRYTLPNGATALVGGPTIPAGTLIHDCQIEVITAATNAGTLADVGLTTTDPNGFIAGVAITGTGHVALAGSNANTLGALLVGADQAGSNIRIPYLVASPKVLEVLPSQDPQVAAVVDVILTFSRGAS